LSDMLQLVVTLKKLGLEMNTDPLRSVTTS